MNWSSALNSLSPAGKKSLLERQGTITIARSFTWLEIFIWAIVFWIYTSTFTLWGFLEASRSHVQLVSKYYTHGKIGQLFPLPSTVQENVWSHHLICTCRWELQILHYDTKSDFCLWPARTLTSALWMVFPSPRKFMKRSQSCRLPLRVHGRAFAIDLKKDHSVASLALVFNGNLICNCRIFYPNSHLSKYRNLTSFPVCYLILATSPNERHFLNLHKAKYGTFWSQVQIRREGKRWSNSWK